MKVHLGGQKCQTDNESKRGVQNWLNSQYKTFYAPGISNLSGRWKQKQKSVNKEHLEMMCEFGDSGVYTLFVNKVQVNLEPPTCILPDSPELMDL